MQRANENLKKRRIARDLHLTRKRRDAMEKKESIMRKKRGNSGMETTDWYDVCNYYWTDQTRVADLLQNRPNACYIGWRCEKPVGRWTITLAQFAAVFVIQLLAALGRQCSLMNEQLSRTIIKNWSSHSSSRFPLNLFTVRCLRNLTVCVSTGLSSIAPT